MEKKEREKPMFGFSKNTNQISSIALILKDTGVKTIIYKVEFHVQYEHNTHVLSQTTPLGR